MFTLSNNSNAIKNIGNQLASIVFDNIRSATNVALQNPSLTTIWENDHGF